MEKPKVEVNKTLLFAIFLFTLIVGLAFGVWLLTLDSTPKPPSPEPPNNHMNPLGFGVQHET